MFNTYTNDQSVQINAVGGTIVKNYQKSFFLRFHIKSPLAERVFSENEKIDFIEIPEGATNEDVVKSVFPNVIINESEDVVHLKYPTVNSDPLFFCTSIKEVV